MSKLMDILFFCTMFCLFIVLAVVAAPLVYQFIAAFPNIPQSICTKS